MKQKMRLSFSFSIKIYYERYYCAVLEIKIELMNDQTQIVLIYAHLNFLMHNVS